MSSVRKLRLRRRSRRPDLRILGSQDSVGSNRSNSPNFGSARNSLGPVSLAMSHDVTCHLAMAHFSEPLEV